MRSKSPQAFQRIEDGIVIFLHPDEWDQEIALPPESTVVHLGEQHENPFLPQWEFRVLEDKTIETLVGYFVEPIPFEKAIEWHRTAMRQRRWRECPERGYQFPTKALFCFQKDDAQSTLTINLQWWEALHQTTAMLRRTTTHAWEKSTLELDELSDEQDQDDVALSIEDAQKFQDAVSALAKLAESMKTLE